MSEENANANPNADADAGRRGQVAIVTGGSQGIGLAAVAALAARGIRVVAAARDIARLEEAVAALPGTVIPAAADVRDEDDARELVRLAEARFGRLDILLNCAGVSMSAKRSLAETTTSEWRRIIDTNLSGTYFMCRSALPPLSRSPDGYIINVQSTAAYASGAGVSLYAASKHGVRALTEALIEEHRDSNLRVTSVSPGPVDTSIWTHKDEPPPPERRALMLRPADIADIFMWLLERPRRMHIPNITVTPWTGI